LSEKRQPEEVVDFLNRYFTVMVDCIQSHGGVVDKFIGDAIMAHWGTLAPSATDTADAIRAALDMRQSLLVLNAEFEKEGVPPLRFGCGINTGPVIAGQIGSEKRLEYTVIGDTVNLASRIEYLNKLFGTDILISSYTMQQVRGLFEAEELPPIRIKGKSEPEVVYAILGQTGDRQHPKNLRELRAMVGI
ncbi:MAG: adenylate/guanylate cyclase domain-containing protein, partial [Leptospiraceae bacterium]|nr:adenylate/guanylate cyclase domain-containing protein [Leptospiraceae bacterium]